MEPRCDSDERLSLRLGHLLIPVDLVLGEVEVVDVPPLLEVPAIQRREVREGLQVLVHVLDDVIDIDVQHTLEVGSLDLTDLLVAQRPRALMKHRRWTLSFGHRQTPVLSPERRPRHSVVLVADAMSGFSADVTPATRP